MQLLTSLFLQESEMVRETSQWEREEMEKVVSRLKTRPHRDSRIKKMRES